jgi:uncharacterized protein (DUF58 family)
MPGHTPDLIPRPAGVTTHRAHLKSKISNLKFRSSLTRAGVLWLLAAAAGVGIALFRSINLLLLLSCLVLALLPLNWLLAGRRARRLRARRRVPQPVFAGAPFSVAVELTNPRAGMIGLRVEDRGDAHDVAWFVPCLRKGELVRLRREITLPRRGRYSWAGVRVWSGYPFGLVARLAWLTAPEEVIVLPRLGRVHRGLLRRRLTTAAPAPAPERRPARRDPEAQADFHSLRTFRSGDSPRWIHWRTSARRGELMVREFEDEQTDNLVLVLDLGGGADAEVVEAAVSLAATVCWEWCRQKGDRLTLAVGGAEPALLTGVTGRPLALRLLECLAVQTAGTDRGRLLDRLAEAPLPRAGVLVVSTQADGFARELARRLGRPVAAVDASDLDAVEFYEGPADHDA